MGLRPHFIGMPIVEYTITLGNIITVLTVASSVIWLFANMKSDIRIVKNDIEHLEQSHKSLTEAFTQLGKILTQVAVQDNRLNMIEKKVDELAHGKGIIK